MRRRGKRALGIGPRFRSSVLEPPEVHCVTLSGTYVDDARRKAYEKEAWAAIDLGPSLPMTSPISLLLSRDSNRPRVPPSLVRFSARLFVRPILPCGNPGKCGRLSRIRCRVRAIGRIWYGGLIISIGLADGTLACDLRLQSRSR